MPRRRKRVSDQNNQDSEIKFVRVVKVTLTILKIFFSAITIFLVLGLGNIFLPDWLIGAKRQIIGISLLALVFLFLLSPLAVEVTENSRPLSGIGKSPKSPPDLPKIDF